MKLNKTVLAVAIAGIAAAPVAQADVTLSGYIGIMINGTDQDGDDGELRMSSDDSTLNVAASHEMNSGLTGYGHWRADLGLSNDDVAQGDNIHLGVKGGFGDVRVGEVPDALEYGQVAGDIRFDIGGEERGVSYTGSFGPATIGLNWSPVGTQNGAKAGGGSDKIAAGVKFALGGFSVGIGAGDVNENAAMSAGLSFGAGGFSIAAAMKSLEGDAPNSDRETISAKVGYGVGNFDAAVTYEAETGDVDEDDNSIRLDLGYGLGGGMKISARFTQKNDENVPAGGADASVAEHRIMLSKSF